MKLEKTLDINFLNKTIALIFILFLIVGSVSSLNINSEENLFFTTDVSKDIAWTVTLNLTETGGKKDYEIFGEAYNASDNLDSYDIPNPPVSIPPFLDAYFSTNFSLPHDRLMQEIKKYPAAYKEWNFTVWWTGSDTTVTISWNITEIAQSEYDAIMLCDDAGTPLTDMLSENNYVFFCPDNGFVHFQIVCSSNQPPVANDDVYGTVEDVLLVVGVPGVLGNDTDFDGPDALTAFLDDDVDHGTLDLDSNGSFEYVPDGDWFGVDSFTYHAFDGLNDSNVALVTVFVDSVNDPPMIFGENPTNGSTGVERPPFDLNVTVEDPDNDTMDIYIRWKKHDFYHFGEWVTLQTYIGVGNGTYNFVPPEDSNDWIWGNTTYIWSVDITDRSLWINETYHYTTCGSRYDVNNDGRVNFQDAGLVWIHRTSEVDYDGIYDVDHDGIVNFQDAGLTWINRD